MIKTEYMYEELAKISSVAKVGKSLYGEIKLFRFGKKPKILLVGGIHAREWITTELVYMMAKNEGIGLDFDLLPCLNPDGRRICTEGIGFLSEDRAEFLKKLNGKDDFSQWKANAAGVDLNVNFDADWGEGRYNVTTPGAENYIGLVPESEPETRFAVDVLKYDYSLVVSYHSLGGEVYWGYEHNFRHYEQAKRYAAYVGYSLKRSEFSSGGLKDYYALNYKGLGLTVEVGEEKYGHPYPIEKLPELYEKHVGSLRLLTELGEEIYDKLYGGSV